LPTRTGEPTEALWMFPGKPMHVVEGGTLIWPMLHAVSLKIESPAGQPRPVGGSQLQPQDAGVWSGSATPSKTGFPS
jgi:hypothetical protein